MGSPEFDRLRRAMIKEALDPFTVGALGVSGLSAAGAVGLTGLRRVGKWRNAGKLRRLKEVNKAKEIARGSRAGQALDFAGHGAPKGISSSHKNLAIAGGVGAVSAAALSRKKKNDSGVTVIKSAMLQLLKQALLVKRAGLTTWDPFGADAHNMKVEKIRAAGAKKLTGDAMRQAKGMKATARGAGKIPRVGKGWKNLAIAGLGGMAANSMLRRD